MQKVIMACSMLFVALTVTVSLGPAPTATPTPTKQVPKGTLTVNSAGGLGMTYLDPHTAIDGNAIRINGMLYGGLISRDPDAKIVPDLAAKWEVSADVRAYKFSLDKTAKFCDGAPVTARDIEFSIKRWSSGRKNIYGPEMARKLDRIEVSDDHNLTIHMKEPYIAFLDRLVEYLMIVPKAYVEKVGDREFAEKPVGAGPFKLVRLRGDSFMELEANLEHHRKVPSVKTLKWNYVPENSTRLATLKTGEADMIDLLTGVMYQQVKEDTTLGTALSKYERITHLLFFDLFHQEVPSPFRDMRVRQACSLAIDRQAICDKIFMGLAEPFGGAVAPYQFGYDPSIAQDIEYDVEKAKKLLAEAGYGGGLKTKIYLMNYPDMMESVAGYLKAIGIDGEQIQIERGAFSAAFTSRKLTGLGCQDFYWAARSHPGASIPLQLRTGYPYAIWSTPEIDAAIDAMEADPWNAEKVKSLSRLIARDLPRVALVATHCAFGIGPKIDYWEPVSGMPNFFRLEYATLK